MSGMDATLGMAAAPNEKSPGIQPGVQFIVRLLGGAIAVALTWLRPAGDERVDAARQIEPEFVDVGGHVTIIRS